LVWKKLKRNKKKNQKEKPARQQLMSSVLTKEKKQLISIHPVGGWPCPCTCRVDRCE
jgi:hypothetical protein